MLSGYTKHPNHLLVEPRPRAHPEIQHSTVLDTPRHATTPASVRPARFVDIGIAACRPLEARHFQIPNCGSPHPLPLIGKLAEARLLGLVTSKTWLPARRPPIRKLSIPAAVVSFAMENAALFSDHRPSLRRTDDLSDSSLPEGRRCSHMRGRELQSRSSRSSVRLVHQPRATRPSPHILYISVLRDACAASWPPSWTACLAGSPMLQACCASHAPDGECDRCSLAPANHGAAPSTLLATAAA
jgi:hypothetical protein